MLVRPIRAQTIAVHVNAHGEGLSGVDVTAWSADARLAGARTDGNGNASFSLAPSTSTHIIIVVRKLGFVPTRVPLGNHGVITIDLVPVAAELPVLSVRAHALKCPGVSDPAAAALLVASAARYAPDQRSLWFGFRGRFIDEDVPTANRGYGDMAWAKQSMGGLGPRLGQSTTWSGPPPYAIYSDAHGWSYAELHAWAAWHFVSKSFIDHHDFVVLDTSTGSTILGFCARAGSGPDIQGEISVGADSLVQAARWGFTIPRNREDAGGEASFTVGSFNGERYLVAIRGSSWRRSRGDFYSQSSFELDAWRFGRSQADLIMGWKASGDLDARSSP